MNKPAYLVEGDLEQDFIQAICPGCTVRKNNCNGKRTSIQAIAQRVGSLGRLLQKRHTILIVVFDREGRTETAECLEQQFKVALHCENITIQTIVAIPDRTIESWILADYDMFVQSAKVPAPARQAFEGKDGKKSIRKALGATRTYVETIDGVAWLKAARPEEIKKNSQSFARLCSALINLECRWLKQLQLPLTSTSNLHAPTEMVPKIRTTG